MGNIEHSRRPVAAKPVHWHAEQGDWYVWIGGATEARRPASRRDLAAAYEGAVEALAELERHLDGSGDLLYGTRRTLHEKARAALTNLGGQ